MHLELQLKTFLISKKGERHSLIYNCLDKNGSVLSWYAPHSSIWYKKVSLCLSNPALAGRADVNLNLSKLEGPWLKCFFTPFLMIVN